MALWSDIAFICDILEDDFTFENRNARLTDIVLEDTVLKYRVM